MLSEKNQSTRVTPCMVLFVQHSRNDEMAESGGQAAKGGEREPRELAVVMKGRVRGPVTEQP